MLPLLGTDSGSQRTSPPCVRQPCDWNLTERHWALALSGLLGDLERAVAWDRVVLELTEHNPVCDYTEIAGALSDLRSRVARIAVDDTGAGFASLRHTLNLSPEIVKLDMEMIQGVDQDMRRSSVAEMILRFRQRMGAQVVTEGVETTGERDAQLELGADLGQGVSLRAGRSPVSPAPGAR